jgi:hypothetical protein
MNNIATRASLEAQGMLSARRSLSLAITFSIEQVFYTFYIYSRILDIMAKLQNTYKTSVMTCRILTSQLVSHYICLH